MSRYPVSLYFFSLNIPHPLIVWSRIPVMMILVTSFSGNKKVCIIAKKDKETNQVCSEKNWVKNWSLHRDHCLLIVLAKQNQENLAVFLDCF